MSLPEVNFPIELIHEPWNFKLMDYGNDNLYLSVTCGRSEVYTLSIFLDEEELPLYNKEGFSYIRTLAGNVTANPKKFKNRAKEANDKLLQLKKEMKSNE